MINFFYSTHINYYFLSDITWNLFLTAIPCLLSFAVYRTVKWNRFADLPFWERVLFVPIFFLWLFFLPNTVYLLTMVRHLLDYCEPDTIFRVCSSQVWVILFFFTFAFIGVPTFIYCLERMTRVMRSLFGQWVSVFFPIIIIPASAIGVLIGLVRRLNSWDILQYPIFTLKDIWYYLEKPETFVNLLVYIGVLYLLYYGTLWAFRKIMD